MHWWFVAGAATVAVVFVTFAGSTAAMRDGSWLLSGKDNSGWGGAFGALGAAAAAIGSALGAAGRGAAAAAGYGANGTISSATPGVQVGRDGAWRNAAAGEAIRDGDFVKVPLGDSVTVTMPDGSTREFSGRVIIPGSQTNNPGQSGVGAQGIYFAQAVEKAAQRIVGPSGGTTHTNSSGTTSDKN